MMIDTKSILIDEYDYNLPEDRIAKFPLKQRDHSKLLVRTKDGISEDVFYKIGNYLPDGSLLVYNDTKVIQARILFRKDTGSHIEVFCLDPQDPEEYVESFSSRGSCIWHCLVGNSKRWKSGRLSLPSHTSEGTEFVLCADRIESQNGGTNSIRFSWDNHDLTFAEVLESCGELPIPPYLNRRTEESDKIAYQTVYSKVEGSVAAPTAGLHFTKAVLEDIRSKGIETEELTLHVGAGTFKPVKSATIAEHEMHSEYFSVKKTTLEHLLSKTGKIVAVGTTSVRTLESLYYLGDLLKKNPRINHENLDIAQWTPYEENAGELSLEESFGCILEYLNSNRLDRVIGHTHLMIAPGYQFKVVNAMITNFHQPKSTLMLLVAAFVGGKWKEIYDYALLHDFRFLSYGDSSLLFPS